MSRQSPIRLGNRRPKKMQALPNRQGLICWGRCKMDGMTITALISAAAAISGIVLGWLGRSRAIREDGAEDGELRASVNYIRQAVDDMRVEIRLMRQDYADLVERVARVEESAKSAHRRIDRLEGR